MCLYILLDDLTYFHKSYTESTYNLLKCITESSSTGLLLCGLFRLCPNQFIHAGYNYSVRGHCAGRVSQ